ncbi:Ceramide kinaselike [Caligus rogercresseyi]|uniref:Ceramide kinaselike n=1 Tax=Caligus rogercresseyi TaxID=217165 RepID=A0A7T8HF63_CALRO|nr:Ceramide kinaselike [Caligus rogercresseyi]
METPLPFRRGDGAHVFVSLGEDTLTVSKEREPDILIPIKTFLACNVVVRIIYKSTSRKPCKEWTVDKLCLQHNDESLLSSLSERIKAFLEDRDSLPKRLLFFVNPFGGKGKAEEIFNRSVRPLLEIAGIHYEMELTQHKNHALDSILSRPDLENQFDGIVSVGGDGMFSEVFNGVLRRD